MPLARRANDRLLGRLRPELQFLRAGCRSRDGEAVGDHRFEMPRNGFTEQVPCLFAADGCYANPREIWNVGAEPGGRRFINHRIPHRYLHPAWRRIDCNVFGATSALSCPVTVTVPPLL